MTKKVLDAGPPLIERVRIGDLELIRGDKIRVGGGSYYITQDNVKIAMGEKGQYVFIHAVKDGIYARSIKEKCVVFIYTGPKRRSQLTGMYLRPHKIKKVGDITKKKRRRRKKI